MPCVDEILDTLTPERLERVILTIAEERGSAKGVSIAVGVIAERLLSGCPFALGDERNQARLRLEEKIVQQVPQIEGLRYFEND